jgi:hypothetical protein
MRREHFEKRNKLSAFVCLAWVASPQTMRDTCGTHLCKTIKGATKSRTLTLGNRNPPWAVMSCQALASCTATPPQL